MLKREGWPVNKTRVYRLYRLEGLQLRMKVKRRKRIALLRGKPHKPTGPNQHWSMDFVHDQTHDGRAFRILTVIDQYRRESVCLEANFRLSGRCVAQTLDAVARHRGWPKAITVDKVLDARGAPTNGNSIACRSCSADRQKTKSDEQNRRCGSAHTARSVTCPRASSPTAGRFNPTKRPACSSELSGFRGNVKYVRETGGSPVRSFLNCP